MPRLAWALAACLVLELCAAGPAHAFSSHGKHVAPDFGRKDIGTKTSDRHLTATLSCTDPLTKCGSDPWAKCVNLQTDIANCGTCSTKCPAGAECYRGICSCYDLSCDGNPFTRCGTYPWWSCRDLLTDEANCGGCGKACPPRSVCDKGTTCKCLDRSAYDQTTQFTLCNNYPWWSCKDLLTDPANCGECNKKCPTGASCVNRDCECNQVDGKEIKRCGTSPWWTCKSITDDKDNCGDCGIKCPAGASCVNRDCECNQVDGKEIKRCGTSPWWTCKSITDDEDNCGDCGIKCPAGASCMEKICICPDGKVLCGTSPWLSCKVSCS